MVGHRAGFTVYPVSQGASRILSQGSIISSIGYGINAIISAIAAVIETIVGAIVAVRTLLHSLIIKSPMKLIRICYSQVLVAIFDVIMDILCCRCFGGRRRTGSRTYYRRRGVFGGGGRRGARTAGTY